MRIRCCWICAYLAVAALALLPASAHAQASASSNMVGALQPAGSNSPKTPRADMVAPADSGYLIGVGDVLSINVWREAEISQKLVVRPDGMITLPLVGDIAATGQTPEQLAVVVSKKLESVLTSPQVSVIVSEIHSKFYVVVGQVSKPGEYPITRPTTVLEAVSQAGGFRDFAKTGKMYVLHLENGKRVRVPFNYNQVVKGKNSQQDFEVSSGDAIVVP
jgi:polysaccharide export outer membrane protein